MSSCVFFKFKSQRDPQRVPFDGTGISVFELKREIINISKLGDGTDFDLAAYNQDTNDEYDDDTTVIPRGTHVIARRLPAARPGAGRAARYVSGKMPVTAKNQHRIEATKTATQSKPSDISAPINTSNMTEEEKIAAMFDQGGQQWEQQQQQMAGQKAVSLKGFVKPQAVPDKPLPPGYTCHRCGEKGHWIQACPTNNDPNFDNRPKFKRTTGIPRSFLKVVEKPATDDTSNLPPGVMYTSTGEWVVAEPDKAAWDKFQAQQKASEEKAKAQTTNASELEERGLQCPIDKRLFVDPVKTPCCSHTYCRDCIENALFSSDFVCPNCAADNVLVDDLSADEDMIKKIKDFEDEKANGPATAAATAPSPKAATETVEATTSATPQHQDGPKSPTKSIKSAKSVTPEKEQTSTPPSKKRKADDDLPNKRIPTAPAAMRQEQQQQQMPNNMTAGQGMDQFVAQMNQMAAQQGMFGGPQGFPMGMPMMGMPNPMMMNGMNGMNGMGGMGGNWGGMGYQQQNMYGGNNNNNHYNGGYGGQNWQHGGRGRGGYNRRG
ncbi:hypothetical protein MBLNU457_7443t1 [Dothideomycetes sp. NU457]